MFSQEGPIGGLTVAEGTPSPVGTCGFLGHMLVVAVCLLMILSASLSIS